MLLEKNMQKSPGAYLQDVNQRLQLVKSESVL